MHGLFSDRADFGALDCHSFDEFVTGVKSRVPYLSRLISEQDELLTALRARAPEDIIADIIKETAATHHIKDEAELMAALRQCKAHIHLLCALCDLARLWDWETVTKHLSDFADAAMQSALGHAAQRAGLARAPKGIFVLALGKYGGQELNYSSDIDIIFFYDPDVVKLNLDKGLEKQVIRIVQRCTRIIDTLDGDGYVFRVDLRLRPDPRSNSVAISTYLAERYYEVLGQNWERAAMIKARVCAGDAAQGNAFIANVLAPYIWRKNLDFAAIADISAMARQIQSTGDRAKIKSADHNIKLGRGGIRSIEFFTQTQQLIHGGRRKELRTPRTDNALSALATFDVVSAQIQNNMQSDYAFLRNIEHRIQMMDDAQDHILPIDEARRETIAWMMGYSSLLAFDAAVKDVLTRVHAAYSALYSGDDSLALDEGSLMFTGVEPEPDTLETLRRLGFSRGKYIWHEISAWLGGRIAATRTPRARELLTKLAPKILVACRDSGQPDEAFYRFSDFLTGLRTGVTVLSMFAAKPEIMAMMINLVALAPKLAGALAERPESLYVLIEPIRAETEERHIDFDDPETAMSYLRLETAENHFETGAGLLTQALSPLDSALRYTRQADRAVQILVPQAFANVSQSLVVPADIDYAVIALGKMGSQEMSQLSDLDLMVLYRCDDASNDGHRFAARMTKRLIRYMTATTEDGPLYDVDMALRPSGGAGPITVSQKAFDLYYLDQAWTWEYMALTRARVVAASSEAYKADLSSRISDVLQTAGAEEKIKADILDMRKRLWAEKPARSTWDIKRVRGGRIDLEFIVQGLSLIAARQGLPVTGHIRDALQPLKGAGYLTSKECSNLTAAYDFLEGLRQCFAICLDGIFDESAATDRLKEHLCYVVGESDFEALTYRYHLHLVETEQIFERNFGKV